MSIDLDIDINDRKAIQAFIIGLVVDCPLCCNLVDCQLYEVRKVPVEYRIEWVSDLSHKERVQYYLKHKRCLSEKDEIGPVDTCA